MNFKSDVIFEILMKRKMTAYVQIKKKLTAGLEILIQIM